MTAALVAETAAAGDAKRAAPRLVCRDGLPKWVGDVRARQPTVGRTVSGGCPTNRADVSSNDTVMGLSSSAGVTEVGNRSRLQRIECRPILGGLINE
jgi:hypothetical protein